MSLLIDQLKDLSLLVPVVAAVPVGDELDLDEPIRTRIGIPVSDSVTLHVGRLPNGNPLSFLPNSDLLLQYMPFLADLPGFGFGVEVNAKERPTPAPQFDAQGNLITPPPRTRKPKRQ